MTDERMFSILNHTTEGETMSDHTVTGRCPENCVLCRFDRHVPAEPERYSILETLIGGAGIGFFLWCGFGLAYAIGALVVKAGAGAASLVIALASGALLALWGRK